MDEFATVLRQMPYVGGAESRMTDFFMRLLGFMAIGRVLRRHGLPAKVIGDIEVETYKAQLLLTPRGGAPEGGAPVHVGGEQGHDARAGGLEPGAKVSGRFRLRFRRAWTRTTASNSGSTTAPAGSASSRRSTATRTSCRTSADSISRPTRHAASSLSARRRWQAAPRTAISALRPCHPMMFPNLRRSLGARSAP